eukprot:CAMPEP_0168326182 /NCGR_PEP_ID=MMETSP0213-20121227/5143_1 /TAXON_ID=151035 /ORGANISM="Euplotes harpa, Strain FSP1.4" /LENGTH=33 /DNA_ID= /DNA_START= /DNA_END= /DNA_ORIENTATION=
MNAAWKEGKQEKGDDKLEDFGLSHSMHQPVPPA